MIMLGYVNSGKVYLATDTRVVDLNDIIISELSPTSYKLKRMKSGIIVGIVGDKKVRQHILTHDEIFTVDKRGNLTKKHITKEIIPTLHKFMKENDLYNVAVSGRCASKVEMFLAKGDRLYAVSDTLWTFRITTYFAFGEFADLCDCALKEINPNDKIDEQLVEIMQKATTYTNYIGGPYVTIDTEAQEYRVTEVK